MLVRHSQAGSPKVDCPCTSSRPVQSDFLLFIVFPGYRLLFWALGDRVELTVARGIPWIGQVGVRAALLWPVSLLYPLKTNR